MSDCKECIFFNRKFKDYKVVYTKTDPKIPIIVLKEDCSGRPDKQTETDRKV